MHLSGPLQSLRCKPGLLQEADQEPDEMAGTWETLCLDPEGRPVLERRDVWGSSDRGPNRGLRFDS